MRTLITTRLDCKPERAWEAVQTTRLLEHVAAPLLGFEPLQPRTLPETWRPGNYLVKMKFLGFIPLGKQWVVVSMPKRKKTTSRREYAIRDDGHGSLAKKWDHLITITETQDGKTQYTDQVDIDAGLLTPLIWLFSQVFYRHRQRRWRALVKRQFAFG